jgi:uncharacterized protein
MDSDCEGSDCLGTAEAVSAVIVRPARAHSFRTLHPRLEPRCILPPLRGYWRRSHSTFSSADQLRHSLSRPRCPVERTLDCSPIQSLSRMKLGAKIASVTVLVISLAIVLRAEPVSQLNPTDYVNDFAHVLDQDTVAQLDNICQQIDRQAHAQISVVTINSLDGADVVSYSVALYQKWGIGAKGKDRGVLILLAIQDRRYWTTVGYGLEPILPDGKVGGFGREAAVLLKQGDYSGAASLMTMRVADVIAEDAGVQLTGARARAPTPTERPATGMSIGGIVVLVVIGLILLSTRFGRLLLWGLLLGGGRGGGFGGGGFGSGGGGGFGGFGGGSTGGGGAGGSW